MLVICSQIHDTVIFFCSISVFLIYKIYPKYQLHPVYIYIYLQDVYDKFPDFFCMGTFIDSTTHETLVQFEVISSGCNALVVPIQQLLEGPMEVLLCERVNDVRHSLFHLLNCLITTASELRE